MPLVRIDLIKGRPETEVAAIGNAVQHALMDCLDVPKRDHFQVITEHASGRLIYDPDYLDVKRTDGIVLVQVFLSAGRSTAQKLAFYAKAAELLARDAKVRPEDVTITLAENVRENWSFGNGVAQYVVLPKEQWK
jgi:4-oxalocrotonate tautomerase